MKIKAESGVLPTSCWCERRIVAVSQADVQQGRTASCGHPRCRPPRTHLARSVGGDEELRGPAHLQTEKGVVVVDDVVQVAEHLEADAPK